MVDHRTAIGDENRNKILNYLIAMGQDDPQTFREISAATGLEYSTVHRHMDYLTRNGSAQIRHLTRAKNGTRMAYVANSTDELSLPSPNGKLKPAHEVLVMIYNTGKNHFLGNKANMRGKAQEFYIDNLTPMYKAAVAIADIYRTANGQVATGYPRVSKALIVEAIQSLEDQIIMLKAIQNCAVLWDRKTLGESEAFNVSTETLASLNEFMLSIGGTDV